MNCIEFSHPNKKFYVSYVWRVGKRLLVSKRHTYFANDKSFVSFSFFIIHLNIFIYLNTFIAFFSASFSRQKLAEKFFTQKTIREGLVFVDLDPLSAGFDNLENRVLKYVALVIYNSSKGGIQTCFYNTNFEFDDRVAGKINICMMKII